MQRKRSDSSPNCVSFHSNYLSNRIVMLFLTSPLVETWMWMSRSWPFPSRMISGSLTTIAWQLLQCVSYLIIIYRSHFSYACKMRYPFNLVLENSEYLWFYWTFCIVILDYGLKLHKAFDSYPCHASEMTRNTLNHCLKFALHSIFCHICYGKISEKNFSTFIKVELLVSKTSDSCFQGFDFFQMLLASHR